MIENLKTGKQLKRFFQEEEKCLQYLIYRRWGDKPRCPKGCKRAMYKMKNPRVYRCSECKKTISVTAGTVFEKLKIPLSDMYHMMYDVATRPVPSIRFCSDYGVARQTAWSIHNRIMELVRMDNDIRVPEFGIWEFDEVYVGVCEAKMNKQKRQKKEKIAGFAHRTPILAFYNRTTKELFGIVIPKETQTKVLTQKIIKKFIHPNSTVYSDKSKMYHGLLDYFANGKQFIHYLKQYGVGKDHSNTIEGSFRHFRDMIRTHKRLTPEHLQKYWDLYCFRYNCNQKGYSVIQKFEAMFDNINRSVNIDELD